MRTLYHLVLRSAWEKSSDQPYRADSLTDEGFIHCSYADQVARSANRFYAEQSELLVLHRRAAPERFFRIFTVLSTAMPL
jgi:uncharacterized protein (DUF952 family)